MTAVRSLTLVLLTAVAVAVALPVAVAPARARDTTGSSQMLFSRWTFTWKHRFVAVQAGKEGHGLHLLPKTARRYAGWSLAYDCRTVDGTPLRGVGGGTASMRPVQPLLPVARNADYCHVSVTRGRRTGRYAERDPIVHVWIRRQTVAITAAGQAFLYRMRAAADLQWGLLLAQRGYVPATRSYPPATTLVRKQAGTVALPTATDLPPRWTAGLWTDGAHRLRVTAVTVDGTALHYDRDATNRETTTNAEDELDRLGDHGASSPWYDFEAVTDDPAGL